jgi:hypothetical protein
MDERFISSFSDEMEKIAGSLAGAAIRGYGSRILGGGLAGGIGGTGVGLISLMGKKPGEVDVKKRLLNSALIGAAVGGLTGGIRHGVNISKAKGALDELLRETGTYGVPEARNLAHENMRDAFYRNPVKARKSVNIVRDVVKDFPRDTPFEHGFF